MTNMERQPALLLLGPTGSGKTPLGRLLESRGLCGTPHVHFDFGESLRRIVADDRPNEAVSRADIEFLHGVLASGSLLEDEQFPLAERILRAFLSGRQVCGSTRVVLNGLPRHAGQANAIDAMLDVRLVVRLDCDADAVMRRLANNVGGDRDGRSDDDCERVRKKLDIFYERTSPLVEHYRQRGAKILAITIAPTTTAEDAWAAMEQAAAAIE